MVSQPPTEAKNEPFNKDEVTTMIKETVESVIQDAEYSHSKVPQWNSSIIDACLAKLKEVNKSYKYVVTCVVMQRNGAGFYAGSSVYWDNARDGSAAYRYENKSLYALVNVFALSV
ncbi:hypothetical protein O0I10_006976 [Lichtheimia ornata]|uniref:Dynein light chain n=1 Tax=Lichtheimia ornata TaxID=688661 RepID=A0AAD7V394_9FUNG|nr:uncharacterized protein O0I10_006976 [Lichtheimia ornata]KAJ8657420.1 hypothetical protein O0I10_006976 [Lichtheimia ornata]